MRAGTLAIALSKPLTESVTVVRLSAALTAGSPQSSTIAVRARYGDHARKT